LRLPQHVCGDECISRPGQLRSDNYSGRNVAGQSFTTSNAWGGPATCYDKPAVAVRAAAELASDNFCTKE
jgi:hypothetical protein